MGYRVQFLIFLLMSCSVMAGARGDECDDPFSSEQIAQCLGRELRDSDTRINASYNELMGRLKEGDRIALRQAQRAWIKDRDSVCQLNTKEKDREKWYGNLLKDYAKTVCVTRYTRQRTSQLDAMLGKSGIPNAPASRASNTPDASDEAAKSELAYDKKPVTSHKDGKWYFEFAVSYRETVDIEPCVLTIGVSEQGRFVGVIDNIRPRHREKDVVRYGFAVDLDNGKLYVSKNGNWMRGEPGSNLGQDLKLGRKYFGVFSASSDSITPYLERKAFIPNFGDTAMTYTLPAGYSPWRNKVLN